MNLSLPSAGTNPSVVARRLMQQAHNRDGLPEIFVGIGLLIGSGMSWSDLLPHRSLERQITLCASILGVMACCLFAGPLLKWLRNRYLFERVGYVQLRTDGRKTGVAVLVAIAVAAAVALAALATHSAEPMKWLIAVCGLMIGMFQVIVVRTTRFIVNGSIAVIAGFSLAWSSLSFAMSLAIFFDLVGALEFITGGVVLLRFLRQPVQEGE